MKSAQGTIRILKKSYFYSELTPFLTIIGGGGSQSMIEGGGAPVRHSERDIKLRS